MNPIQQTLIFAVRVYRLTLSPAQAFLFGRTEGCRFTPTCSQYAIEAIDRHGAVTGTVLTAKRLCRCHPWGGCGHDPVPETTDAGRDAALRSPRRRAQRQATEPTTASISPLSI